MTLTLTRALWLAMLVVLAVPVVWFVVVCLVERRYRGGGVR